jgi:YD repeat-containing protein
MKRWNKMGKKAICPKCGRKSSNENMFCPYCGEKCSSDSEKQQESEGTGIGKKKVLIGAAVAVGAVCVVLLVVCVSLLVSKGRRSGATEDNADSEAAMNVDQSGEQTDGLVEPLYGDIEIPTIVLHSGDITPNPKSEGMLWDDSFFNWLEDIDATSDADGNIYYCNVEKTLRYNYESGYMAEYDVYRDADTNQIYKVISIEPRDGEIVITDYYYKSGEPNFIFYRSDSIYTPTYASLDIVGQRFYFDNDSMVRWGTVETPGEMGEYVLTKIDVDYAQLSYYDQTETVKSEYDWTEEVLLKEAYNVYNDLYDSNNVGILQANVHDVEGAPVGGMMVEVYRSSDDVLLYRTYTDDNGDINLNVLLDGTEFYIVVYGGDIYEDTSIYGLRLDNVYPMNLNDSIVLHKIGGDEYSVTLWVVDSTTVSTENGSTGNAIPNATAYIRNGASSYSGDVVQTVTTSADGQATVDLKTGTYTVQIDAEGFNTMYCALEVGTEDTSLNCYAAPINNDNKKTIVLTWDNPDYDLDLTIFTPYQGSNGDMAYIGSGVQSDSHGNYIQSDNSSLCEVAYIDGTDTGDYKIYVNNYTDTQAGNLNSAVLCVVNVHVYIYANNVLVADYTVPIGANGVVWEVVEISGTTYLPCQRVYSDVSGKRCWSGNKTQEYHLKVEKTISESTNSYRIDYNYYDIYGNLQSSRSESRYNNNPETITETTYKNTYDSQGRLVSRDDGSCITEYEYDEYGNVISETPRDKSDGKYYDKTCHEYTYYDDGQIESEFEWTLAWYDNENEWGASGSMGMGTYYDEEGRIIFLWHDSWCDMYVYGENYDIQELANRFDVYNYDAYVIFCNDEGDEISYAEVELNNNNKIEIGEVISSFEYEYDAQNNIRSKYSKNDYNTITTHYSYYEDDYVDDIGISYDDLIRVLKCAEWLSYNGGEWYVSDLFNTPSKMKYFLGMLEQYSGTRDIIASSGNLGLRAEYLSYTIDEYNLVLKNLFDMEYDFSQLEHINISNTMDWSKYETDSSGGDVYYADGKLVAIKGDSGSIVGSGSDIYIYRSGSDVIVQSDLVWDGDFDVYGALKLYLRKNSEGKYYIYKMGGKYY